MNKNKTMETNYNQAEILNLVKSHIHHININNFDKMAQRIVSIPIKTVNLFEKIMDIIYAQVLNKPNFVVLYARLCAYMIKDTAYSLHNSKTTFEKVLERKSYDVFISHNIARKDLRKLKEKFKKRNMTPYNFKNILNNFYFKHYNRSLTNCKYSLKFIGELFKQGALAKKVILASIEELMEKKDDLKIHCLCIILKIAGPKLSKTHNLDSMVNYILLFKNENSVLVKMSSTLSSLIFEIQKLHLKGWINEEPVKLVENNKHYFKFEKLPEELKKIYELKSYNIMAQSIIDECVIILNDFEEKKSVKKTSRLINNINSWTQHDPVSFVVSMILITLNENKSLRCKAGILLDELVTEGLLLSDNVLLGIHKVMDDSELVKEFTRLSDLLYEITSRVKFHDKIQSNIV